MSASPPPDHEAVAFAGDTSFPETPPLDIERYRAHLDGLDLSEAQATELLETLWSILSAFVDQAFGVDSVLLARPQHRDGPTAAHGYEVEAVFAPGMVAMLRFMEANRHDGYVVIFDDLQRFARDTIFHLKLRQELAAYGASVECLNFKFEDTPEGQTPRADFSSRQK